MVLEFKPDQAADGREAIPVRGTAGPGLPGLYITAQARLSYTGGIY